MRFCGPAKAVHFRLLVLLVAHVVAIAAAWANPLQLAPHTANVLIQVTNILALSILAGAIARSNRRAACSSRWNFTRLTVLVLVGSLLSRLGVVAWLRSGGRDSDNYKAKYVRWDRAAAAVGTVAVLAEMYFALVPRQPFRIAFFLLGLCFVLPAVVAAFEMFGGLPPAARDPALLKKCLGLSAKAYDAYDPSTGKLANRVHTVVEGDTTYVSFAGTEDSRDAKIDANIGDVELPKDWTGGRTARAHAGFVKTYAAIRDAVKVSTPKAVFTGHSLGGALATLAALDFAPRAAVTLVTFGAPHVGDGNFVRLFDATVPSSVRVVNPYDPVTRVLGAQLLHTKGYYPVTSLSRDFPTTAHSLSTYHRALGLPRWMQVLGMFAPVGYIAAAFAVVALWHLARHLQG